MARGRAMEYIRAVGQRPFAMSERNLARLVVKETGLSFRRWRHQLQLITALRADRGT